MTDGLVRPTPAGTVAVRDDDAVDAERLRAWLGATMPSLVPAGATLMLAQFPAGFSNLTYLVSIYSEHGARAYVLRRPPLGVTGGVAHNMRREHDVLAALHPLGVPVPRPVVRCDDASVIGAPFYLMEHVDGLILRGVLPPELAADEATLPLRLEGLSRTFILTLAQVHAVEVEGTPLATIGNPTGYVQRQVQGWTTRWHAARTMHVDDMERVAAWLDSNRPPERGVALLHNDFKYDNLVLAPDSLQVRAILDWEMATVGDPLMDLGTTLAYWIEAGDDPVFQSLGLGITAMPGSATRAELVRMYAAVTDRDVSDAAFYYAFGLFKVAVIAQQIFARYVAGKTRDERFKGLGRVVEALAAQAMRVTRVGVV